MRYLFLLIAVLALAGCPRAYHGQTYRYKQYGGGVNYTPPSHQVLYGPNGQTWHQYGNTWYGPKGQTISRYGNTYYGLGGQTWRVKRWR